MVPRISSAKAPYSCDVHRALTPLSLQTDERQYWKGAATGLLVGILCAGMVFAYVPGRSSQPTTEGVKHRRSTADTDEQLATLSCMGNRILDTSCDSNFRSITIRNLQSWFNSQGYTGTSLFCSSRKASNPGIGFDRGVACESALEYLPVEYGITCRYLKGTANSYAKFESSECSKAITFLNAVASSRTLSTEDPRRCSTEEFMCADKSGCIKKKLVCDDLKDPDCPDGSDEAECPISQENSTETPLARTTITPEEFAALTAKVDKLMAWAAEPPPPEPTGTPDADRRTHMRHDCDNNTQIVPPDGKMVRIGQALISPATGFMHSPQTRAYDEELAGFRAANVTNTAAIAEQRKEIVGLQAAAAIHFGTMLLTDIGLSDAELSGATRLRVVYGGFHIRWTGISSTPNFLVLEFIQGAMIVESSTTLLSLSGYGALIKIGSFFHVNDNPWLVTVSGFGSLIRVGANMYLYCNPKLENIEGFAKLQHIGGLTVKDNMALVSVAPFVNLTRIDGQVEIYNNGIQLTPAHFPKIECVKSIGSNTNGMTSALVTKLQGITNAAGCL